MKSEIENEMDSKIETPPVKMLSREEVLGKLSECINSLQKKSISGRLKDPDTEKFRDNKMRLTIYACSTYLSGIKDQELQDLEVRLTKLEGGST